MNNFNGYEAAVSQMWSIKSKIESGFHCRVNETLLRLLQQRQWKSMNRLASSCCGFVNHPHDNNLHHELFNRWASSQTRRLIAVLSISHLLSLKWAGIRKMLPTVVIAMDQDCLWRRIQSITSLDWKTIRFALNKLWFMVQLKINPTRFFAEIEFKAILCGIMGTKWSSKLKPEDFRRRLEF